MSNNSKSHLTSLCDDTLLRILSYCNLPSLVNLTRCTSNQLRSRFDPKANDDTDVADGYCQNLWREVFAHHNFAPLHKNDLSSVEYDYYNALRHRLQLFARLAGKRRGKTTSKKVKQCFSLPNRHFHFVPIVPPDMMNYPPSSSIQGDMNFHHDDFHELGDREHEMEYAMDEMEFDPPPVEFTCDSFCLTSHSTGTEYVLLNPFSGSIEVYNSILDNALDNEENLMELAMYDASENIIRKRNNSRMFDIAEDERSEDIAGEAIHSKIQPKMYDTPPSQVLFSVRDYFDLDLNEYFGGHTPFGAGRRGNVTVDWVGVDTHAAVSRDCTSIDGNLIGAARILTMESEHHGEDDLNCTEVLAWSNIGSDDVSAGYTSKYVCRAAGSFYFLDIHANTRKLYATFQGGSGGYEPDNLNLADRQASNRARSLMEIDDESLVDEGGEPIRMSRAIFRLPLVKYEGAASSPDEVGSYFPSPEAVIMAQYPVSSFSVDISGELLIVGTIHGTVEMWHTGETFSQCASNPRRLEILSVREFFLKRARSMTIGARCKLDLDPDDKPDYIRYPTSASQENETQDDLALIQGNDESELPHKNPTCKISQIYLPRHLPVQSCGFVTKQRDSESGTTLLLWQTRTMSSDAALDPTSQQFQIVSMINLPLSSRCHPEVHYDGRRLIVFGQDHIGLIFLVYHVLGTRYDQNVFQEEALMPKKLKDKGKEESGGVINLLNECRIKFVNRIRHAGLGGLEYFDSLIMTANERFIVVNTKSGNLIVSDGSHNSNEGLLVIDLEKHGGFYQ